jgi:Glycosyltransferase family 9 (heptosyltransferase)
VALSKPASSPSQQTVLVLRALGLGDALTAVPALRGIRRRWPGHRLVLAAPASLGGLLQRFGVVDDVLPTSGLASLQPGSLREYGVEGEHIAVNLHGRGPQSHDILQATEPSELVAFRQEEAGHLGGPVWKQDEHEVVRWCRLVRSAGGTCGPDDLRLAGRRRAGVSSSGTVVPGPIVVHPGAASGSRRWPVRRWREVAAALGSFGLPVAVTGSAEERELSARLTEGLAGVVDLGGRLTLEQLSDLVRQARLVLCGDTGVAHLATAWGTPSVVLFGPTPPRWWGPAIDQERHTVLWHGDPGDLRQGDPHGNDLDPRLAEITVADVLDAAHALLEREAVQEQVRSSQQVVGESSSPSGRRFLAARGTLAGRTSLADDFDFSDAELDDMRDEPT